MDLEVCAGRERTHAVAKEKDGDAGKYGTCPFRDHLHVLDEGNMSAGIHVPAVGGMLYAHSMATVVVRDAGDPMVGKVFHQREETVLVSPHAVRELENRNRFRVRSADQYTYINPVISGAHEECLVHNTSNFASKDKLRSISDFRL